MKRLQNPSVRGQNRVVDRSGTAVHGLDGGGRRRSDPLTDAQESERPENGQSGAGGRPPGHQMGGGGLRFHRPARAWPLSVEAGPILLPPVPAARQGAGAGRWQMLLPVVGSLAMVGFAFVVRSLLYLIVIGLMVVSMVGATLGAQMAGNREEKRRWANTKKRYLELISRATDDSSRASELQLAGLAGLYPGPGELLGLVKAGQGIWERRRTDPDFGWARLGLGAAAAARPVRLGDHGPSVTEPDPELAHATERAVAATATIPSAPVTAPLAHLGVLAVVAPGAENLTSARAMVAAWLASLAALHAPGDLRIAGLFPLEAAASWDWLKWLPHCRALQGGEGFGRARRSVSTDPVAFGEFTSDLVRLRLERPRGAGAGEPSQLGWEHVVVVVDGWSPARSNAALDNLMTHGPNVGVSVIVVVNSPDQVPSASGATAAFADDGTLLYVEGGPAGRVEAKVQPDQMSSATALDIARRLAPLRLGWEGSSSAFADSVRLCELLGAEGPADVARATPRVALSDVAGASGRQQRELLRVPVGRDEAGNAVELDLKEAASGGMGPTASWSAPLAPARASSCAASPPPSPPATSPGWSTCCWSISRGEPRSPGWSHCRTWPGWSPTWPRSRTSSPGSRRRWPASSNGAKGCCATPATSAL